MFCAVYDSMSFLTNPFNVAAEKQLTEEQMEQYLNHYLLVAHWRYRWYLDLLHSLKDMPRDSWPAPPWYSTPSSLSIHIANSVRDVAMMMHTHMLHPVIFQADISSSIRYKDLTGLIDFPLAKLDYMIRHMKEPVPSGDVLFWHEKDPKHPYTMMEMTYPATFPPQMRISVHYQPTSFKMAARPPPFGIDLRAAVKRQIAFARKITSVYPYDPVPEHLLLDSQKRYAKFMNLIRMNRNPAIVPAVDVDLFWHTHQLTATNYLQWCTHHVGLPINHDDTVSEGELSSSIDNTVHAWQAAYSEGYLNPPSGSMSDGSQVALTREPNITDETPPPGLTPAQLNLWHFDVKHQEMHEGLDYYLRQKRMQLKHYNRKLAACPSVRPASSSNVKGGGGFMKRLAKAAKSELVGGDEQSKLEGNQRGLAGIIQRDLKYQEEERQAWGRQRWPFLVAARGWGDPRVTEGKWVRPAQGTTSLDFPIYAATSYDNKELGYYNYISGGREGGGGIEGGGIRLGGAMCAGKFDGGNCVAEVYRSPD
jgi:Glycine-rich domain-containing protein-like